MADDSWADELNIHKAMVLRYDVAARNLKLDPGLANYLRAPEREGERERRPTEKPLE